jgi:hypothetical protein
MRAANPAYNSFTDLFSPQVCLCVCALRGRDNFLIDKYIDYLLGISVGNHGHS